MIFVSYSHKDKKIFEEFKTMLAPAAQGGLLEVWDDQKIRPGEKWEEKIQEALSAAEVAVLLVSQHFLASHFITKKELLPILNAARERGVIVFWIYVSSCLFEKTEIASYQAAYDISRPLDRMKKAERQAALSKICFELLDTQRRTLEKTTKNSLAAAGPLPEDKVDAYLECCLLISEAVETGFDASRSFGGPPTALHRKLDLARRWLERGMKLLPDTRSGRLESLAGALREANTTLRLLISEAKQVFPELGGTGEMRDDEHDKAQYSMRCLSTRIREALEDDPYFMELKNSDRKWTILGFRDKADFDDYLYPSLKRLATSTDPMQRDLFERLLKVPEFTPRQLAEEGYRRDLVMDSLNALLTEQWAEWTAITSKDDGSGRVTEVGRRLLKQVLEKN